jgi:phosphonate transport system substrate-binding protein
VLIPVVAVVAVLFLTKGNGGTQDTIRVNLEERTAVSPVQQIGSETQSTPALSPLRVAVAGVLSPTKTLEYYQELLAYMEQKLGRRVTLILRPTYAEVNDMVKGQGAHLGIVCSLAYIKGNDDFGMELLVAPQMHGGTVYYSYLLVAKGNSATTLVDLRDSRFAFTDPMSNSGHLVPTYQLSLLGETPDSFFRKYLFTYSHDNSIMAVADTLVDGAAVDSLVYDKLVADNPELASKTKVIARWGPYGIPPLVVSPALAPGLKQQLRAFFLDLHKSDEGMAILNNLAIDKFVVVPDSIYDSIRDMKTKLGW